MFSHTSFVYCGCQWNTFLVLGIRTLSMAECVKITQLTYGTNMFALLLGDL